MKREEIICTVVDQNALQVALLYVMYGLSVREVVLSVIINLYAFGSNGGKIYEC